MQNPQLENFQRFLAQICVVPPPGDGFVWHSGERTALQTSRQGHLVSAVSITLMESHADR